MKSPEPSRRNLRTGRTSSRRDEERFGGGGGDWNWPGKAQRRRLRRLKGKNGGKRRKEITNKKGEKCTRPEERDEVLQTKGNARELFERGGGVNKDAEETENEMVERKKSTNGAKRDSSARCSASPFFFFLLFFFCSPPAKAFCPATPGSFSG